MTTTSEKNSRKLCITKKIKGDIPVNDKFDFEIKLNGQKYTGNYYLQDSEGNYYTSENGPLKKAKNKTVCGSAVNGVVSSVPAGYTVVLEQILAGTSFEVNEINLNQRIMEILSTVLRRQRMLIQLIKHQEKLS